MGTIERIETIETIEVNPKFHLKQHIFDLDKGQGVKIEDCLIMYDNEEKGIKDIERLKNVGEIMEIKSGMLKVVR